jgi:ketosteroid isomerase-like protein
MSQENVELAWKLYAASNRGDVDFQIAHASPDCEFRLHRKLPGMEVVYRGHDGIRKFAADWLDTWETLESVVDRIIDVDDERVLGLVHLRGVGRGGIEVAVEYAHLMTIRDGQAVLTQCILGWSQALEAAGLSE